ncbi:MAG: FHA domain-containing protein [Streptosporangiaceae bacterium]|nr:FHA domain-containing protein [Streptosporangiaceae bacterium]MBV9856333.1 FHA domain-containing protein [Streptosporangiaceae bacterium]
MSALTLTLIRVAFLAVLWLFVIAAIGVVRTDLFGSSGSPSRRARARARAQQAPRQPQRPPRQPRPGRSTPRVLLVTDGALKGTSVDLAEQQITLGRSNDATLVLNDDYASSRHARIFPQDGQWIVEDLGSTNGTYLDRQKVTRPMPVPVGVPIRIGKTVLELRR